ncbi:MAG: response regulator transcription factor, partial [candidate division WOR-3 bacterium]
MSGKITLVLADDEPLARAGIRDILAQADDIEVLAEAQDGSEAQRLVAELRPHILLLDLKMPGPSPAELEAWVRQNYPQTITLILTAHDRDAYLAAMMEAGAAAYLTKAAPGDRLIASIRRAARGEALFDAEQRERVKRWKEEVAAKWERLTPRERDVLCLLAQGADNKEIAAALAISVKTVESHVTHILETLGVVSR